MSLHKDKDTKMPELEPTISEWHEINTIYDEIRKKVTEPPLTYYPIKFIEGDAYPHIRGNSGHYTYIMKGGGRHWHQSTYRIEVGIEWLRINVTEEQLSIVIGNRLLRGLYK